MNKRQKWWQARGAIPESFFSKWWHIWWHDSSKKHTHTHPSRQPLNWFNKWPPPVVFVPFKNSHSMNTIVHGVFETDLIYLGPHWFWPLWRSHKVHWGSMFSAPRILTKAPWHVSWRNIDVDRIDHQITKLWDILMDWIRLVKSKNKLKQHQYRQTVN